MIMPFIQQKFNVTVLPLALCLLYVLQTTFYYITDKTINERTHLNFSLTVIRINRVAGTEHSCGSQVGGRIDY